MVKWINLATFHTPYRWDSLSKNIMSIIKHIRENSGYTQLDLSKKTGLSLRTIQRLDASEKAPKGHTLKVISEVFELEPSVFQKKFQSIHHNKELDFLSIKYINLSALAFFVIPFGNIILPVLMWRKKRRSKLVDEAGKRIINFQILWSILLCLFLCVAPFFNMLTASSFPLILVVLFVALLINIVVVIATAIALQRNNVNLLNSPIRFL